MSIASGASGSLVLSRDNSGQSGQPCKYWGGIVPSSFLKVGTVGTHNRLAFPPSGITLWQVHSDARALIQIESFILGSSRGDHSLATDNHLQLQHFTDGRPALTIEFAGFGFISPGTPARAQ